MAELVEQGREAVFWFFNVLGPLVVYAPQWLLMRRKRALGSFSKLMCYCLILAHLLRLVFRLSTAFHPSLVVQSVLVLCVQSVLLHTCLRLESGRRPAALLGQQLAFLLAPVSAWALLYCVYPLPPLAALTGALSALFEAVLPLPQIVNNHRRGSVEGLSLAMIAMWALGDGGKLGFFLWERQPLQFVLCAAVLLSLDLVVLGQFWLYGDAPARGGSPGEDQASPTRSFIRGKDQL